MSGAKPKKWARTIVLNNAALQPIAVAQARRWSDKRGFHLISDVLSFGRLLYGEPNATGNAISYEKFFSRLHRAVMHVYEHPATWSKRASTQAASKRGERCGGEAKAAMPKTRRLITSVGWQVLAIIESRLRWGFVQLKAVRSFSVGAQCVLQFAFAGVRWPLLAHLQSCALMCRKSPVTAVPGTTAVSSHDPEMISGASS